MAQILPKQIDWTQPISGSLLPFTSSGQDVSGFSLGSPERKWNSLYVENFDLSVVSASNANFDNLEVSGSFFLDNENIRNIIREQGIFSKTGSFYSTNQDIKITGSLDIELDGDTQEVTVSVSGSKKVKINSEGILVFNPLNSTPTPITGGLYYDINKGFYLGL